MPELIQVSKLVKHYNGVKAVNGISFSVTQGQCLGLLGPNGAGKTTTVEMLEGITPPTHGEILYKGAPLGREFRNQAGIMFQSTALQEFVTVRELLKQFQQFYLHSVSIDELIERCALEEFLNRDTRKLSGGQRQRLLFAIALVNDPEILFLDEPTTGLDPQARRNFWALIRDIKARNKTIILTTHYMEEAYALCDEIIIMDHGQIIAQGTPKSLLARHFNDIILHLPLSTSLPDLSDCSAFSMMRRDDGVEFVTGDITKAMECLLQRGVSLQGLKVRERTLEDLFIELTGKEMRT
jgi:ABC-2 type transport system ATP-binding protein